MPSLAQLEDAVAELRREMPDAEVTVVVDATFAHRIGADELSRFEEAALRGEYVYPPAGAIGRGDAFLLRIAERVGALVLSNDSFQEFHGEHSWLFDEGRLIGGKPVRGVGWIFTPRLPVRGVKSQRATKAAKKTSAPAPKLVVKLPGGATPSIGDTLTPPVKKVATKRVAKKVASEPVAEVLETTPPVKKSATKRVAKKVASEPVAEVLETTPPVKKVATKRVAKKVASEPVAQVLETTPPVKKVAAKRVAKKVASEPVAEVLETTPPVKKAATKRVAKKVASEPVAEPAPRHRAPVNGEEDFRSFARYHRPGSKVTAVVHAFTSHGALVHVTLRSGAEIECYAPKTGLASPPPPRARDVLRRGEQRSFTVVSVDLERRTAEVSLI